MCNNIRINSLSKRQESPVVKDKISDWQEERKTLRINVIAKASRKLEDGKITYAKRKQLHLHNKTRIYEICEEEHPNRLFKTIAVKFANYQSQKVQTFRIRRYAADVLTDVEKFLEHSQSIAQLRNIDLDWK